MIMDNSFGSVAGLASALRVLAAEGVEKAKSGHPGMPMGSADYAAVLWAETLQFNPQDPHWPNRDRFVLSAGHGCMLLYTLLHLFGYDLPMSELQNFRQWGSKTPGHPEFEFTTGVETTTGPLGAGFSNGVGLALSGKLLAQEYSPEIFNYRVFGIVSDGDLMEGISHEAASLAGHLGLDNLIYIYDDNHISIGGDTKVTFTESVPKRFEAYGWHVQSCDGHNQNEMRECLKRAVAEKGKPKLICARTTIGFGAPHKAGDAEVHGAPLGAEELAGLKKALGWPSEPSFFVPPEVSGFCSKMVEQKKKAYAQWHSTFKAWGEKNPSKAALWRAQAERLIPSGLKNDLIKTLGESKKDSTRNLSGKAIQVIAKHIPYFIGGSADLEPSTKTLIKDSPDVQAPAFVGRNLRFGVREHGMGGAVNGLAYTRSWIPYGSTFLVFSDYMRPTVRLAAISHLQSLFIFTHDSFWVGEDGPTHQPIEHIQSLRLIPNTYVYRPADGLEVAMSYMAALETKNAPSVLLFTRQDLPVLERPKNFVPEDVLKGAYVVVEAEKPEVVIVATGSEVWVAVDAAKQLGAKGKSVRVVSMPCAELFLKQSASYQATLIPRSAKRVLIEAGTTVGWERIVGCDALMLGINHFGASAPGGVLAEKFGFTPPVVVEKISQWLNA
jgi:transketolase